MKENVVVGVDCGELDLKTAYVHKAELCSLPVTALLGAPLIYFDSHSSFSSLGIGFPSTLHKVGTGLMIPYLIPQVRASNSYEMTQSMATPDYLSKQALTIVRQHLADYTGGNIGATVLAVPTTLRQSGRKALLECAQAAGFKDVAMVDRCTAAALGYHHGRDKTTALVFDIGHGECEFSLLRLAKDRCRVVASDLVTGLSGERFDTMIMEAVVLALRKHNVFLGLKQLSFVHWFEFRQLAENVRISLRENPEATLTLIPEMTGLERPIQLRINGRGLAARVAQPLGEALSSIHGILEQNELTISDLDVFLLVGEAAIHSPVADIFGERFQSKLRSADPYLVAYGAALQAYQATELPSGVDSLPLFRGIPEGAVDVPPSKHWATVTSEIQCELAEVIAGDEAPLKFNPPSQTIPANTPRLSEPISARATVEPQDMSVGLARRFAQEGDLEGAVHVINVISQEINAFVRTLQHEEALTVPRARIQQASAMINIGRFAEAVKLSHDAYRMAPTDPDVFSKMLKIHADAGLAMNRPEEYEAAISILKCAHGHDPTDRMIHKALAERHYMHAVAMRDLNNISSALSITKAALSYDPRHDGANRLIEELTKDSAARPSQEAAT